MYTLRCSTTCRRNRTFLSWLCTGIQPATDIRKDPLATVNRAIGSFTVSSGACARGEGWGCRPNILARAINSPRGKGAARILPKILHTDYLSAAVAARRAIRRLVRSIVAYKSYRFVRPPIQDPSIAPQSKPLTPFLDV